MRSRKEQIAEAKQLGIWVETKRRTGEVVYFLPGQPRVTQNNRRKDGTRAVEKLIERVRDERCEGK